MAQDTSSASTEEPMTDNPSDPSGTDVPAAPVLNRAQRRAKGKSGAAPSHAASPQQGGSAARASGQAGQVRFPRTGHK